MFTLVRHYHYEIKIGNASQIFRIEELVSGPDAWGGAFRLVLPASGGKETKTIYGATADEVANRAAELMNEELFCNPPLSSYGGASQATLHAPLSFPRKDTL